MTDVGKYTNGKVFVYSQLPSLFDDRLVIAKPAGMRERVFQLSCLCFVCRRKTQAKI